MRGLQRAGHAIAREAVGAQQRRSPHAADLHCVVGDCVEGGIGDRLVLAQQHPIMVVLGVTEDFLLRLAAQCRGVLGAQLIDGIGHAPFDQQVQLAFQRLPAGHNAALQRVGHLQFGEIDGIEFLGAVQPHLAVFHAQRRAGGQHLRARPGEATYRTAAGLHGGSGQLRGVQLGIVRRRLQHDQPAPVLRRYAANLAITVTRHGIGALERLVAIHQAGMREVGAQEHGAVGMLREEAIDGRRHAGRSIRLFRSCVGVDLYDHRDSSVGCLRFVLGTIRGCNNWQSKRPHTSMDTCFLTGGRYSASATPSIYP